MSKMQKYTSLRYVDMPCKHGKNGLDHEFQKLRVVGEECVTCGWSSIRIGVDHYVFSMQWIL